MYQIKKKAVAKGSRPATTEKPKLKKANKQKTILGDKGYKWVG